MTWPEVVDQALCFGCFDSVEARSADRTGIYSYENRSRELGPELEARFRAQPAAWDYFHSQAPWYRATASYWVVSARREKTRERRFAALVEHSRKGERIPPLARPARARGG